MVKDVSWRDSKSGHVIHHTFRQWRRTHPWGVFMQMSCQGLAELEMRIADHTLGIQAVRVLMYCLHKTEWQNRVSVGRKDIAAALKMDPADVAKALRKLVDSGFIEKPQTRHGHYTMSPRFVWMGNLQDLRVALSERDMLDARGFMRGVAA